MRRKTNNLFQLQSTRGVDYRLLGLPQGESDVVRIRGSVTKFSRPKANRRAKALVHGVNTKSLPNESIDAASDRILKVTLAGYRLLDPRFRRELYDRVQLSYIVFRELDEQPEDNSQTVRLPLLPKPIVESSAPSISAQATLDTNDDNASEFDEKQSQDLTLAFPDGELELADSPISDAREIVRMIQASTGRGHIDSVSNANAVSRWIHSALQAAASVGRKTLSAAFHGTGTWYVTPTDADEKLRDQEKR